MNRILHISTGIISLILCFAVGATVLMFNSFSPAPPVPGEEEESIIKLSAPQPNANINVLILGVDEGLLPGGVRGSTRTDTMMLASFNPATSAVNVLSLPRDSRVVIPGRAGYDKLGHAHAYKGGLSLITKTVEQLLGLSVHYYVRVDHGAFRKIIDAIGGVDYYVERDMFYEDPYQDLYIDLKQGQQRLDGDKAEQYVRYRGGGSDIERIGRQQKFLMAAVKQALRPANLLRVNQLFDIVVRSVTTNFDGSDFLKYVSYLDGFSDKNVATHVLEGDHAVVDGKWFWELDRQAMDRVLAEHFWDDLKGDPGEVSLRLIDASGEGRGEALAELLARRGFNVVSAEAAEEIGEGTTITAHGSRDAAALMVYRFLRQGSLFSERVERDVDVTVIIGKETDG
jgi:LCP family protein required for cell wall assembly